MLLPVFVYIFIETLIKELGHQQRPLDFLKVDTDKHDGTGFEDTVREFYAIYSNIL